MFLSSIKPRGVLMIISAITHFASSAPVSPFDNDLDLLQKFTGYESDPNGRGTVSLVLSCLLTLLLCVWSALHLNVPRQGETRYQAFMTSLRWIIVGIYAPELVVFTAWRQWSSAKLLGKIVRDVVGVEIVEPDNDGHEAWKSASQSRTTCITISDVPPKRARRHKWTRTHDFFACTGGFAFELPEEAFSDLSVSTSSFLLPDCPRRLTLTARGVALLAKCGHLPDIPEEEILDKSKANNLAKAMVVIQAIWMLLQVGGRLVEKLPVTLLEVNTVAHVLCALLMYAMWWHKPLLPQEPMILKGDWIDPLCAYMYVCSELSGSVEEKSMEAQTAVKSMFASLKLYSKSPEVENLCHSLAPTESFRDGDATEYKMSEMSDERCLDRLNEQRARKASDTAFFERRPRVVSTASTTTVQSPSKIQRLELAAAAMSRYEALKTPETSYTHCLDANMCYHPLTAEYVAPRVMNWPYDDLLRNVNGLTVGLLLWLSNFCYGALHTAAWNDHFPTDAEKWLWRCSSVYISFCGALWIFVNWIAQAYKPLNDFWENWVDGKKALWHNVLLGTCVVICGTAFGLARFYIVVEAFVSIRHLPLEAYATPSWTQVLPHL